MRIVLDCNVVVAAARTEGVCRAVLLTAVRHHQLVLSAPIISEYRTVGARPKHKPYHRTMLAITDLLEQVALIVEPGQHSSIYPISTMRSTSPPHSPAKPRP